MPEPDPARQADCDRPQPAIRGRPSRPRPLEQALNHCRHHRRHPRHPGRSDSWTIGSIASRTSTTSLPRPAVTAPCRRSQPAVARAGKTLAVIPTGTLESLRARCRHSDRARSGDRACFAPDVQRAFDVGFVNDHVLPQQRQPRQLSAHGARARRGSSEAAARARWRPRSRSARRGGACESSRAMLAVDGRRSVRRSPFIVVGNGSYVLSGFVAGPA